MRLPRSDDATSPPEGWDTIDDKTGAPPGIDKGWGYAPGANVNASMQSLITTKLINLDASIAAAMAEALKPVLMTELLVNWQALFDATRQAMLARGNTVLVHTVAPKTVAALLDQGVVLKNQLFGCETKSCCMLSETTKQLAALPYPTKFGVIYKLNLMLQLHTLMSTTPKISSLFIQLTWVINLEKLHYESTSTKLGGLKV